jgi:hypothetical protein
MASTARYPLLCQVRRGIPVEHVGQCGEDLPGMQEAQALAGLAPPRLF